MENTIFELGYMLERALYTTGVRYADITDRNVTGSYVSITYDTVIVTGDYDDLRETAVSCTIEADTSDGTITATLASSSTVVPYNVPNAVAVAFDTWSNQ
jgi:hypothetical protein